MPAQPPTIYAVADCNGAGKTTFANEFLPKEVKCLRFLNADEIARELSPLMPSAGAVLCTWLTIISRCRHAGPCGTAAVCARHGSQFHLSMP